MKQISVLLFALLISSPVLSQEVSNWKVYSSMRNVFDAVETQDGFWAAAKGGTFFYSIKDNKFFTHTKSEGFSGYYFTAIAKDQSGKIWLGSQSGKIDVFDPADNSVKSILDIYNSDRTQKQINEIKIKGDTIIIASDFGISLINRNNYLFYDTYFKLGQFESYTPVKSSSFYSLFYAATEIGLAVQRPGTINLSAPESWNVYTAANGLPSRSIVEILKYKNKILVVTDKGLAEYQNGTLTSYLPQLNNTLIKDAAVVNDSLYILSGDTVKIFVDNFLVNRQISGVPLRKIFLNHSNLMGISASGLYDFNNSNLVYPPGPAANQFPSITVDSRGHLWSASGKDAAGLGIYEFTGEEWNIFDVSNTPIFSTNDFYSIYAAPDNTIYAGSWGYGFVEIKDGNIKKYDASNTEMRGIAKNPNFLVISGFARDSKNNTWILNYSSVNRQNLSMITPDSSWHHFVHPSTPVPPAELYYNLVIDDYDTKWFYGVDQARPGLYYFNENRTLTSTDDDRYGFLNQTSGLVSSAISAVVVDRRGDIWVTTNSGVNIISNPGVILSTSSQNPQLKISTVFSLRQQAITCIAVDPLNRKWVGTNQGLILVSPDGTSILNTFNSSNSPLPANKIVSLAVDNNSGIIYAGTDEGLVSFETSAKQPVEAFTELFVYPNPYRLKNNAGTLTIDGLIKDAEIKIISINGKLIREFFSPGGRIANWDGRDEFGELVASGVYLIIAYDKDGNNVTTSKIAVLRE